MSGQLTLYAGECHPIFVAGEKTGDLLSPAGISWFVRGTDSLDHSCL